PQSLAVDEYRLAVMIEVRKVEVGMGIDVDAHGHSMGVACVAGKRGMNGPCTRLLGSGGLQQYLPVLRCDRPYRQAAAALDQGQPLQSGQRLHASQGQHLSEMLMMHHVHRQPAWIVRGAAAVMVG